MVVERDDMSSHRGRKRISSHDRLIAFSSKQGQPVRPKLFKIMDKEELKMRRRQQMMFKINEKYIKDLKLRNLHEFYLENEKILNDYEKTRTN